MLINGNEHQSDYSWFSQLKWFHLNSLLPYINIKISISIGNLSFNGNFLNTFLKHEIFFNIYIPNDNKILKTWDNCMHYI
jgi:hypothetical protein